MVSSLRGELPNFETSGARVQGRGVRHLGSQPRRACQSAVKSTGCPVRGQSGALRWFLVAQRVGWPTLVGGGAETAAKAYGVEEIPANFLIGRDGTIKHVELNEDTLAKVLAAESGQSAARP